jgi:inosine-uridine nucleoside N-ribohydrolase
MAKRIILDCDPGIDDAVAIILALKSPELHIEAITTETGNLLADRTGINARKILELMNRTDIPVAQGALAPLIRKYPRDPFSHGDDGLGNTGLPAPIMPLSAHFASDLIVELARQNPGEITLVATGPLTNVALALIKEPQVAKWLKQVILIGGAFGFNRYAFINATGDNPVSEWNVFVDPEAARIVFHSGLPIIAVGLDVATHPGINFAPQHIAALEKAGNRESRFLLQLFHFVEERKFQSYCVLIDSMAVAAAIQPSIIKTQNIYVDIETAGELTLGQTVVDHRLNFTWKDLPQIQAACEADFPRFHELLIQRIIQ